jgi:hypothetical protein
VTRRGASRQAQMAVEQAGDRRVAAERIAVADAARRRAGELREHRQGIRTPDRTSISLVPVDFSME